MSIANIRFSPLCFLLLVATQACQFTPDISNLLGGSNLKQQDASIATLLKLDDSLRQMTDVVIAVRTLSIAASTGTYNVQDRRNFKLMLDRYKAELGHIRNSCVIKGQPLLDQKHQAYKPDLKLFRSDGSHIDFKLPVLPPAQFEQLLWDDHSGFPEVFTPERGNRMIGRMDQSLELLVTARTRVHVELDLLASD